jgi:hypothetical protein
MVEVVVMSAKDVLGREGERATARPGTQLAGLGEHAPWLGVAQ